MRLASVLTMVVLLLTGGCRSQLPVSFYGKDFSEYMQSKALRPPLSLPGRWRVISFNGECAPYDLLLEDLDLTLTLGQSVSDTVHHYGGQGIINGFAGDYTFSEWGEMAVLSMGGTRVAVRGDKGRIENTLMRLIKQAQSYEIRGAILRLYTEEEFVEFRAVEY